MQCSGVHHQQLQVAGCNDSAIATYCHGDAPPGGDVHFPGSRIILNNATWSDDVNTWAKGGADYSRVRLGG